MYATMTDSRLRHRHLPQKKQINHNLEEQAQALYKSWFVDFEPFKDGEFVESELGMIPKGWSVKVLGDIASIGKQIINPQKHPDAIFSHYSIPAYDNSESPEVQKGLDILSNKFVLSDKSVLFSKLNPRIKRIWNVYSTKENAICSTEFVVYKPINNQNYGLLFSIISGDYFYDSIMSKVNGATGSHQRFHPEDTLELKLPYDPNSYKSYSDIILPILQQIEENKLERTRLSEIRDSLLPRLMSGELNINEIDC